MYRLRKLNVIKLTDDPQKRDKLIADGFELISCPAVEDKPVVGLDLSKPAKPRKGSPIARVPDPVPKEPDNGE